MARVRPSHRSSLTARSHFFSWLFQLFVPATLRRAFYRSGRPAKPAIRSSWSKLACRPPSWSVSSVATLSRRRTVARLLPVALAIRSSVSPRSSKRAVPLGLLYRGQTAPLDVLDEHQLGLGLPVGSPDDAGQGAAAGLDGGRVAPVAHDYRMPAVLVGGGDHEGLLHALSGDGRGQLGEVPKGLSGIVRVGDDDVGLHLQEDRPGLGLGTGGGLGLGCGLDGHGVAPCLAGRGSPA